MNMLFSQKTECFSLKLVFKIDSKKKKKKIYKVGKDEGLFAFSHFVKLLFCIFVFLGRKNGYLISCCGNIKKRIMCYVWGKASQEAE